MHIELGLRTRGLSLVVFVFSFCYLTAHYRALPALFTVVLSLAIWLLYRLIGPAQLPRKVFAYSVFFCDAFFDLQPTNRSPDRFWRRGRLIAVGGRVFCDGSARLAYLSK